MQHAALQSMYVAPRAGVDPRIANTVTAERQDADNGILYMLDDPRDIGKYRVMSQADLKRERIVYEEVAATVQKRSSKVSTEKRTIQVGPPVGKRARQIQNRAWNDKMKEKRAAAAAESRAAVSTMTSTEYSVNRTSGSNSRPGSVPPGGRRQGEAQRARSGSAHPRPTQSPAASATDDSELETLKYKYAQNLSVIERLAAEKEEMAKTLQMIQAGQLDPTAAVNFTTPSAEPSQHSIRNGDYDDIPPPAYTEDPDEERYVWQVRTGSERLSAAEASHLFDTSPSKSRGRSSLVKPQTARSGSATRDPRDLRGFGGAPVSPNGFVRSKSFDAPRRARSAPRSRLSGGVGLSFELQADYDRYLQKKRDIKENERKAAQEKEIYEAEQRRRFARASKQGSEFRGIKERDKTINIIKQKRAERVMRQSYSEKEKELDVEADKKRKYALAAQASFGTVNDMGKSFSWRDMEEQDEIRRRERVELRKMELANSVAYPSQEIEQSVEQWKLKKQGNEIQVENYIAGIGGQQRRASDPKQIISKLERQHNLWERRLEREMQQSRMKRSQIPVDPKVVEMERRNAEYTERRRAKLLEKDRAERAAKESKKTKEAERMKTLINAKPPAWKLTKTAEDRAKLAKEALEEEVRKQRKEALLQKKKEGRSKEISAYLHSIISQESGGSSRKSEIRMDDSGVPLAVIEKRRADALKAKENKDRIKEFVAKRPSLIERHNQQVAQANARAAGLQKVANAICDCNNTPKRKSTTSRGNSHGSSKENDDDDYADEFFDFEERLEIGH